MRRTKVNTTRCALLLAPLGALLAFSGVTDLPHCLQPWVNVYVTLPGVGAVSDNVTCDFGTSSFDLQVRGLNGKNFRLLKPHLDKDVVVDQCKCRVKADKIVLKLRKVKGEYSYDNWTDLAPKKIKSAEEKAREKDNPSAGIMGKCHRVYCQCPVYALLDVTHCLRQI